MTTFRKGTTICFVQRNEAENIDKFIDRGNFIASQKPQNDQEYDKSVVYSNIHINVKYLKCTYGSNVMQGLEKMKTNL